jgi:hypothetical protein
MSNVQSGVFLIVAGVLVFYTWYSGAWAWLFQVIEDQVRAGGTVANPRIAGVAA